MHGYSRVCDIIGPWAYPLTMGIYMMLSGFTLFVLVPPKHKKALVVPWLRDRLAAYEKKFEGGSWQKVRKRGGFTFVLVATTVLNPVVGALAARTLGLSEERIWRYAFGTNLIASVVWTSVYIGAGTILSALS